MSFNSKLGTGIALGAALTLGNPGSALAKSPRKEVPAQAAERVPTAETVPTTEVEDAQLRFQDFLEAAKARSAGAVETQGALTLATRHEFCLAVTEWAGNYMKGELYNSERTSLLEGEEHADKLGPQIGQGEFFTEVVAPTFTKGCLTQEERHDFFNHYKLTVVQYYSNEMSRALKEMSAYERRIYEQNTTYGDPRKGLDAAQNLFRLLLDRAQTSMSINYETLFSDQDLAENPVELPHSQYVEATTWIKIQGTKPLQDVLEGLQDRLNTANATYEDPKSSAAVRNDAYKAMLLLYDYQSKLMRETLSKPGYVTGSTVIKDPNGGESFEPILQVNSLERKFEIPELSLDDLGLKADAATGDSLFLRLAELSYYSRALWIFNRQSSKFAMATDPNAAADVWQSSLAAARMDFVNVPVASTYPQGEAVPPTYLMKGVASDRFLQDWNHFDQAVQGKTFGRGEVLEVKNLCWEEGSICLAANTDWGAIVDHLLEPSKNLWPRDFLYNDNPTTDVPTSVLEWIADRQTLLQMK